MTKKPDPRINAYSRELASMQLKGLVEADRFEDGRPTTVSAPVAPMYATPSKSASLINQAIMGDQVNVFEIKDGWAWGQLDKDDYVGFLPEETLCEGPLKVTHKIAVPASFLYPKPDLKSQPALRVFLNSTLEIVGRTGNWAETSNGKFVYCKHICPVSEYASDPVSQAERFLHAPYLWGGSTVDGLDCSALVQQAYHACGKLCPRDTDLIEAEIATDGHNSLERGDLIFWDGHIGLMVNGQKMIHANGYHMAVAVEDFATAEKRINREYGSIARIKRKK